MPFRLLSQFPFLLTKVFLFNLLNLDSFKDFRFLEIREERYRRQMTWWTTDCDLFAGIWRAERNTWRTGSVHRVAVPKARAGTGVQTRILSRHAVTCIWSTVAAQCAVDLIKLAWNKRRSCPMVNSRLCETNIFLIESLTQKRNHNFTRTISRPRFCCWAKLEDKTCCWRIFFLQWACFI